MNNLENKFKDAAQAYYSTGESGMSDEAFDAIADKLQKDNPDSELLSVGWGYSPYQDTTPGNKYPHKYGTVGSLSKARNWSELYPQYKDNSRIDISAKLDGLSVVLYYHKGKLVQALTRGADNIGIDITNKVRCLLPEEVADKEFTGAVRGEIIMSNPSFDKFKQEHPEAKNPRNCAVGLINSKDISPDIFYLSIVVYSVIACESSAEAIEDIYDVIEFLRNNFVSVVPRVGIPLSESSYIGEFEKCRDLWSEYFPIDGLVLVKDISFGRNFSIEYDSQAFKFMSEVGVGEVVGVEWNMSKTGYAIPKVKILPIDLAGSTIQYCTGYNAKYIIDNNIGVGSAVTVEKRGEIIPNINDVIIPAEKLNVPTHCPICDSELAMEGVHLVCNNPSCTNASYQDLNIWLSTLAPIDGLGDSLRFKFLDQFIDAELSVETIMSPEYRNIYNNTATGHLKLFADMGYNLHNKLFSLVDAIVALNIPRFGTITATKFANYPGLILSILDQLDSKGGLDPATLADLNKYIGVANTESLCSNISKLTRLNLIKDRIVWQAAPAAKSQGKVAITGKLSVKRDQFEFELNSAGYSVGNISKDCLFLITDDPHSGSSKNAKADSLGIPKITEDQFRKQYLLGGESI